MEKATLVHDMAIDLEALVIIRAGESITHSAGDLFRLSGGTGRFRRERGCWPEHSRHARRQPACGGDRIEELRMLGV